MTSSHRPRLGLFWVAKCVGPIQSWIEAPPPPADAPPLCHLSHPHDSPHLSILLRAFTVACIPPAPIICHDKQCFPSKTAENQHQPFRRKPTHIDKLRARREARLFFPQPSPALLTNLDSGVVSRPFPPSTHHVLQSKILEPVLLLNALLRSADSRSSFARFPPPLRTSDINGTTVAQTIFKSTHKQFPISTILLRIFHFFGTHRSKYQIRQQQNALRQIHAERNPL